MAAQFLIRIIRHTVLLLDALQQKVIPVIPMNEVPNNSTLGLYLAQPLYQVLRIHVFELYTVLYKILEKVGYTVNAVKDLDTVK